MTTASRTRVQQVPPETIREIIDKSLALDEVKLAANIRRMARITRLWSPIHAEGTERIPTGPVLFVGNHSTMAMDALVAFPALLEARGHLVRVMNDEMFYRTQLGLEASVANGAVLGHREIGDALFAAGKDILLFPGGAYEANKDLHLRYTLQWKQRMGFVRMAAAQGVPIVPMGIVGPDEWFDRWMDRSDVASSWLGSLLRQAGVSEEFMQSDQLFPIPRGVFGTMIPKPQASYICFGEPVHTAGFEGRELTVEEQRHLRDLTHDRLQTCIYEMLLKQAQGKDRESIVKRLLSLV